MPSHKLDFTGALSIVVGSILGSGVFLAPGIVAGFSGSPLVAALLWIVGGLACAAGAAIYGSLGLLFPENGGQYVYLRESLSFRVSRFYGWASVFVLCPTMLAGMALFFAEQCGAWVTLPGPATKGVAITLVAAYTLLNMRGLEVAAAVQKAMVLLHVVILAGVLFVGLTVLPGAAISASSVLHVPAGPFSVSAGLLALSAVLWSFEGFNSVTFITREIEGGERNVRRIALVGCGIVVVLYAAFNFVVLSNLPADELRRTGNAAATIFGAAFGAKGSLLIVGLTLLAVGHGLHTAVIIGPRIIAATARDAILPTFLGRRDARTGAPNSALVLQFVLVSTYIVLGDLSSLITGFVVMNWLFYGLTVVGYLRVRNRQWRAGSLSGREWTGDLGMATLFLGLTSLLLAGQFAANPLWAGVGLLVSLVGCALPATRPALVDDALAPELG